MMSIIEVLENQKKRYLKYDGIGCPSDGLAQMCQFAIDEIQRLQAERDELAASVDYLLNINIEQGYAAPVTLMDYLGHRPRGKNILAKRDIRMKIEAIEAYQKAFREAASNTFNSFEDSYLVESKAVHELLDNEFPKFISELQNKLRGLNND